MSSTVVIIAGVAIVAYTIASQLRGTAIRAKRLIILPGIIAAVGVGNLAGSSVHPSATDVTLIAIGAAVAAATGLSLGAMMRLERRDGALWGKLAARGLWLWVAFFASRGVLVALAHSAGAHVASGTHAELLILGINRLGQALVVAVRARASGIPFAAESDGSRPLAGLLGTPGVEDPGSAAATPSEPLGEQREQPFDPRRAPSAFRLRGRLLDQIDAGVESDRGLISPRSRRQARRARRRLR